MYTQYKIADTTLEKTVNTNGYHLFAYPKVQLIAKLSRIKRKRRAS